MHIDSLNYFFQVANSKSISTVAKNAHISQSALSQQILKLENNLNVKLLNRSNKGVSLTPEGEILFKYCESILSAYNKMQEELLNSINKKKYISIEAVESISLTILPVIISKLKKVYSSYTINLNTIECCTNTNLLNNICDIYICYKKPEEHEGIVTKQIGSDEIVFISDANFPINTITKDQLFDLPIIFTSDETCLKQSLSSALNCTEKNLDNLNILYSTNSYFSALNGVLSSKAVTFVPMSIYNNYCSTTNIKRIQIENFSISLPLYINYLNSFYKINSEFIKSLKNMLKGYLI
ncbi:LysR family transcriptional regulator [Clostridium sp. DSM 100503]|uniref:LysR family transcriptional regulator n=1 Tax=Clostridium sp. DSM 100503 TaxID=2963282 RepID=UPI00214A482E|nr:LysR family transcriptional regulator [Clostridium sp. DSM 100503]MCR1951722.1 LysR family transcriptional regulator [Clostridium sp. DSM 100503]